jgi:uncharacterized protein (DUF1501 family)
MEISRRDLLLKGFGFVTVSALVPRFSVRGAPSGETIAAAQTGRTLVIVELMGGNDGLNTVVPYSDPQYPIVRSRIGVDPSTVLDLDNNLGLNPVLTGLKSLWDSGRLAVVEGISYPNPNLSHFASRDIWHTADPTLAQERGWLGRWADQYLAGNGNALSCCAISQSLPKTLLADHVVVPSFISLASYGYSTDGQYPGNAKDQINAFVTENSLEHEFETSSDIIAQNGRDAIDTSATLKSVASGYTPMAVYPANSLAQGLLLIAQIIAANLGARILYVTYGGFDNHASEDKDHDALLQTVSDSIKAFWDDISGHGLASQVLLMTWSEFGRRVEDNASNGTDHGTAAPQFVIGEPASVKRGIYGPPPDLTHLDVNGNLLWQNDFRSYYGTILEDWLGADPSGILGPGFPNLGFLNT